MNEFAEGERLNDLNGLNYGRRQGKAGSGQMAAGRIKNFEFRICRNAAGFTLMEVIIIIVLVGIFMAACGMPFVAGIRESELPEIVTVANLLAIEKIEELSGSYYCSLADEARAQVSGFTDYEMEVSVTEVNATDLSTPEAGSGYSKITVTVYHSDKLWDGISLVTLRTDF